MSTATLRRPQSIATIHHQIERIVPAEFSLSRKTSRRRSLFPWIKLPRLLASRGRTLHRRKLQGRSTKPNRKESFGYQLLLKRASDVFGDQERARRWLTHRSRLGQHRPDRIREERNWAHAKSKICSAASNTASIADGRGHRLAHCKTEACVCSVLWEEPAC